MQHSSNQAVKKYEAIIIKQLPMALQLYGWQRDGDPAFFSDGLKHKDMLHEFRYMLMVVAYASTHEATLEFWRKLETQAQNLSVSCFHDLKREVLVNVAIARAFDKLKIKFWWAYAEDNDIYRLTFRFIDGTFAYAAAADELKLLLVEPQPNTPQEKYPHSTQAIANRLHTKGYYFAIPDSSYDGTTGEPIAQLVTEIAQLNLPPLEQWHAELQKLQNK